MSSITEIRHTLRSQSLTDESALIRTLIAATGLEPAARQAISTHAETLVTAVRKGNRLGLMESFLAEYGLATDEGVALMSLAEALLRVPDAETVDALIHDKVGGSDWTIHFGASSNQFVNFSSWALSVTADVLGDPEIGPKNALHRAIARLGEPVIRTAVAQAMRLLGSQFVFGRTIDEAMVNARKPEAQGYRYSYDMLGEAARTSADAVRYFDAYARAIATLAPHCTAQSVRDNPGISVKLSALHPRYEFAQRHRVMAELVESTRQLALAARAANMGFNIDAEEADRLDLSLDIIAAVLATPGLAGWDGFGVVVQAYGKRVLPLIDWLDATARSLDRRIMVRLVKGAYWDAEIKRAQVLGLPGYPVFTRKASTDISYIAAAKKLFAASSIYPQFATHNAHTASAVLHLAAEAGRYNDTFEFQRLHGMGEGLYDELAALETGIGEQVTPVRIYAPVGSHKELLAYLVRRLLENGANSSFVNRVADEQVSLDTLVRDPVAELEGLEPKRNPVIPLPNAIFGAARRNSAGVDLSDPLVREPLLKRLLKLADRSLEIFPTERSAGEHPIRRITSPHDDRIEVGIVHEATERAIDRAMTHASRAQPAWDALGGEKRADLLDEVADLFERDREILFSLCIREAGKTLPDAVLEVREAVDFLRYYASEARSKFARPVTLPGPTGELNELRLHGRGVWTCISPWNFPLAIFTGPVAAALAAGNAVMAKPAEQTPLIGAHAIALMHEAGIPREIVQLMPGDGRVGAALCSHALTSGVAFTGSTDTARLIARSLAERTDGPIVPLVAETGGQNAMIVDSSALPEQVTRDVVASSFQSAGQRCSALRVLYIQDDVADEMVRMIAGAMECLGIGDPSNLTTDVGPVIDSAARQALRRHLDWLDLHARKIMRRDIPDSLAHGFFVPPAMYEIDSLDQLTQENFGPILHVVRWKAGELDRVIQSINRTGYGLTLGLQSRIDTTREYVEANARVGNLYVNRNQIGAVVESQPFGGEGLSGTGPKAGGPHYVARFATERVTCIDTTAAGGNASLMAAIEG